MVLSIYETTRVNLMLVIFSTANCELLPPCIVDINMIKYKTQMHFLHLFKYN